jgi:hypothetical protein
MMKVASIIEAAFFVKPLGPRQASLVDDRDLTISPASSRS